MVARVETPPISRVFWLVALLLAEIAAIILVLQVFTDFECRATQAEGACRAVRSMGLRGLCILAALTLFLWIRKDLGARLLDAARMPQPNSRPWLLIHVSGLLCMLGPWLAASGTLEANAPFFLSTLALGGAVAALGGAFWAVPPRAWRQFLQEGGLLLGFAAVVAAIIPDLADAIGIAWTVDVVLSFTFWGIVLFLNTTGAEVWIAFDPPRLGVDGFIVEIADSCSGVEGLALITGFLLIYSVVMRGTVRQDRLWMVVWPLALFASWTLNVVRIGILMLIGAHVSPDLAVNGFHSFAGWIFFTLLALTILTLVPALTWLDKTPAKDEATAARAPLPPLTEDWSAARIVPFIVFMVSGMLAPALLLHPELAYPAQMLAIGAALWLFRKGLGPVLNSLDPMAIAAGVGIAALWIGLHEPADEPLPGLATLGPVALAVWVAFRVIGTTLVIPIVEEAFFRGYLMTRLNFGGRYGIWIAVALSTAAFAALHGRYLEAGIAGLVFAAIMLRRGRLADAVLSHAVANGLIAAMALALGDWSLI